MSSAVPPRPDRVVLRGPEGARELGITRTTLYRKLRQHAAP